MNDLDLNFQRPKFHLTPEQHIYAFLYTNTLYQELRPQFAKNADTVAEISRLLENDPVCPISGLSSSTIQKFLALGRGRLILGQWHFTRSIDPVTGNETGCMSEGARINYPHPSNWSKARKAAIGHQSSNR